MFSSVLCLHMHACMSMSSCLCAMYVCNTHAEGCAGSLQVMLAWQLSQQFGAWLIKAWHSVQQAIPNGGWGVMCGPGDQTLELSRILSMCSTN